MAKRSDFIGAEWGFKSGDPWGECQRCGRKRRLSKIVEDGYSKGLRVCRATCYDPPHPQERVRAVHDEQRVPRPAPRLGDIFVNVGDYTRDSF